MSEPLPFAEQFQILIDNHPTYRDYSASRLAREIGTSTTTILRLLNGKTKLPGLGIARQICTVFNIKLSYFDCESAEACREYLRRKRLQPDDIVALDAEIEALSPESRRDLNYLLDLVYAGSSDE